MFYQHVFIDKSENGLFMRALYRFNFWFRSVSVSLQRMNHYELIMRFQPNRKEKKKYAISRQKCTLVESTLLVSIHRRLILVVIQL